MTNDSAIAVLSVPVEAVPRQLRTKGKHNWDAPAVAKLVDVIVPIAGPAVP